ncbi:P27 family phage terminase small subunit [Lysinibacillus sp. UGB7]|uniref:P27 family phage terminase small subunit n=1 Tax=Lysinibacillus sp. UGB7 TaxID=3411039 RepID=UPI003B7827D1
MSIPTAAKIKRYLAENYQESDDEIIKLYVETHKFYRRLKKEVDTNDLMMEHTNKAGATNVIKNPMAIELTKTVLVLNNLLKSLGLTPAQRKQLEGDDSDEDFDKF